MSQEVEVTGKALIVTVDGTLDGVAARSLSSALRARGFPGALVVVEMANVTSVDVEGITQLVGLKRWAERDGGRLVLAAPSYEVMDALRSNDLDRDFKTAPSRAAAVDAAGGMDDAHGSGSPPPTDYDPAPYSPHPLPGEPEPFGSRLPSVRAPEESERRRDPEESESNEWVKPSNEAATRPERSAPLPVAPPPIVVPRARKGRSPLPLILILLAVLGGGGAAAWYFFLRKVPEVIAQEGEWKVQAGSDAEFKIRFRHANELDGDSMELPRGLTLDSKAVLLPDGTSSQAIAGISRDIGEHLIVVRTKAEGGNAASPQQKFRLVITGEEVTNAGLSLPADLRVGKALPLQLIELVRGCSKATATGLDGTGLSVATDTERRVATLEGKPEKEGAIAFAVSAENESGKPVEFKYSLTIQPETTVSEPPKVPVHNPLLSKLASSAADAARKIGSAPTGAVPEVPNNDSGKPAHETTGSGKPGPDATVNNGKPGDETTSSNVRKPDPPPADPAFEPVDPKMIRLLNDRIASSRFPDEEKSRMRDAVSKVEFVKVLATVRFGEGERTISPREKERLLTLLRSVEELKDEKLIRELDFVVIGYASRTGTVAKNIVISKARAAAVAEVLDSAEFRIVSKFTGDYGATNVLGSSDEANRVVEVYAVKVKDGTRDTLRLLIDHMKAVYGSR